MSSITINLIRESTSSTSSKSDDVITIKRNNDNINVRYVDRQNGSHSTQNLTLSNTGLKKYIQNLGHLFLTDTQPFTEIQFNFPGFPSYLLTQDALHHTPTQDSLMDIADIVNDSWFEDVASDTYADMPALIPLAKHNYYNNHQYCAEDAYTSHY